VQQVRSIVTVDSARERLDQLDRLAADSTVSPVARGLASFAAGLELAKNRQSDDAVRRYRAPELEATELGGYALFEIARELEDRRPDEAIAALKQLVAEHGSLAVADEARLTLADLLAKRGEQSEAAAVLQPVSESGEETTRGEALAELGQLFSTLKRYDAAVSALETLYYEMPRHPRAPAAGRLLTSLRSKLPDPGPEHFYRLGLARAEILLDERRYSDAYRAFAGLLARYRSVADEDLLELRLGVCRYRRRQLTASLGNFKKVARGDLAPEALYYRAEVARRLRRTKEFAELVNRLLLEHPSSPWAERGLFSVARHYDSEDEIDLALSYYREVAEKFPRGEHALEARWQVLWHAYRTGNFEEAAAGFEEAAREQPQADELPRFLYWAGRSYQEAGRFDRAEGLFRQVLLGYQNTYYGRRAFEHLSQLHGQQASLAAVKQAKLGIELNDALVVERTRIRERIAQLYALGLEELALAEAEKAVGGHRDDSAFLSIEAWIHAERERNLDVFRTLQQAFPFHGSATGDLLPRQIWELLYPLHYWEFVRSYSAERGLDPFLVAALIRQESTFNPRVRSPAGARGLMQIIPSTGRILARQERRRYDVRELYNPEINVRYGTRYLKEILGTFDGRVDYALASYNAGPHRVKRWTGMDMSIDPEVFIEEIPFDETRLYVKLVLRNEMLYRRLYGGMEPSALAE
jgi:soluble lytic murein transglycosylase